MSMPWYGELPERWDVQKTSGLFSERQTKVSDTDFAPLSVSKGGIVPQMATVAKSNAGDNRKLVRKGDFVINSRSDRRGSSGVSQYDGSVSLINIVLEPRKEENGRYFHYLLRSPYFIEEYYRNGRGIVADLWTTRYTELKTIYLPLPPRDEQDQIVRYLDWKVSQINRLINAKRRQIALLHEQYLASINNTVTCGLVTDVNYKDTEIAWIDKMPVGWNTSAIKNHFRIEKRIAGKEGYDVLSITQKGIRIKDITTNEGQMAANYANYQFVYPGDFAMNHMDLLTGYIDISKHFGVTSPDYRVFLLTDTTNCFSEYFLRVFQVCYRRKIFYGFGRGAASHGRWRLPKDNFLNFLIPLPPMDEQRAIAKFCLTIENTILSIVTSLENEINLLTEYRTRLISDVVTGKLDVRGVVVPEYEVAEDFAADEGVVETEETEDE